MPADAFLPRPTEPWAPRRNRHGYLTGAARTAAETVARRLRAAIGEPPSRYDADPDF